MKQRSGGSRGDDWTGDDVAKMVTNPTYAGVGPYPAVVTDEQWVDAVAKLIKQRGAAPVLREILKNLREAFPAQ